MIGPSSLATKPQSRALSFIVAAAFVFLAAVLGAHAFADLGANSKRRNAGDSAIQAMDDQLLSLESTTYAAGRRIDKPSAAARPPLDPRVGKLLANSDDELSKTLHSLAALHGSLNKLRLQWRPTAESANEGDWGMYGLAMVCLMLGVFRKRLAREP
jgi:hypothetical protein